MRAVFAEAGLDDFTRIAESPNHIVYEARPAQAAPQHLRPHHILMTSTATPNHNVGSVMANAACGVLASNIMASIALGTSRFVFVWLVGELTEWNPATAILGIVIGLPPYCSRRGQVRSPTGCRRELRRCAIHSVNGAVHHLGRPFARRLMTVPVAMACGLVTAIAPAMLMPSFKRSFRGSSMTQCSCKPLRCRTLE